MTTATRATGPQSLDQGAIVVRRTAVSGHGMTLATAANAAALDHPPARFLATDVAPNVRPDVQVWSYTATPQAAYLWVEWVFPGNIGVGNNVAVTLSITDGTNTVSGIGAHAEMIPAGFRNETLRGTASSDLLYLTRDRYEYQSTGGAGIIDLSAATGLASVLTASADWTFKFSCAVTNVGYVQRIQAWELPRFVIDDSSGAGVIPGAFFLGSTVTDDPTVSVPRILTTLQAARTTQTRLLTLSWDETTGSNAPTTTATSDGVLSGLTEVGTTPMSFRVPVRQVYAASAQGEVIRWRVRYQTQTGTAAKVKLHTGSSASPFTASLADTSSTWAWSAWQAAYVASNGGGTPPEDVVSFTGNCTVAAHQLWIDAIEIEGNCA